MKMLLVLILAGSLLTGCVALVAGGAGAGAVAFAKGEYVASYERNYEQTWQAALDTMKEERISLHDSSKDGGLMEGNRTDGEDVKLVLESVKPDSTEVRIRVGNLGMRSTPDGLIKKIGQRLGIKSS